MKTTFARIRSAVRPRVLAALALALVPVLSQPAAAQQRDRSMNAIFRNDAPETATRMSAQPAQVWRALGEVYGEMGFAMASTSNARGLEYLTPFMDLRGRLFNRANGEFFVCQSGDLLNDLTNTGQITFAVRARVAPGPDGGSVLHTQVDARAHRRNTSSTRVDCNTTGKLEGALAQLVEQRVEQLSAPAAAPAQPE